jgi:4'-phosphopantetheinyl transferase
LIPREQPRPPAPFELSEDAVHVWVVDLDAPPWHTGLLSSEERTRAERFRRERDRLRWTRAREALRLLLGEYLRSDPRAVRFDIGARGKPELVEDQRRFHFNLAHAAGVAVYAVTNAQPVGVDIELPGRSIDVLAVAERALGPAASARLRVLRADAREREFLRQWVRHEATLKCRGTGLGGGGVEAHGGRPWVSELDLPPRWSAAGAVAAVAVADGPSEVSCREWTGELGSPTAPYG